MTPRLQKHLRAINEWEGETTHIARSGCAIALRMLGVSSAQTQAHIGWKSEHMLDHYTHKLDLIHSSATATLLARSAKSTPKGPHTSTLVRVGREYQQAFPSADHSNQGKPVDNRK